jgi:hypothetical protein
VVKELQKLIREFAHAAQVELSKVEDTGELSPRSTRKCRVTFILSPDKKRIYASAKTDLGGRYHYWLSF